MTVNSSSKAESPPVIRWAFCVFYQKNMTKR
nr:MAG TPA: hypothetical protein [Caudoviricetes sp.]